MKSIFFMKIGFVWWEKMINTFDKILIGALLVIAISFNFVVTRGTSEKNNDADTTAVVENNVENEETQIENETEKDEEPIEIEEKQEITEAEVTESDSNLTENEVEVEEDTQVSESGTDITNEPEDEVIVEEKPEVEQETEQETEVVPEVVEEPITENEVTVEEEVVTDQVIVTIDLQPYGVYDLNKNGEYTVTNGSHTNTFKVEDGYVKMIDANCNDKLCLSQGKIHTNREMIICLPNKMIIEIENNVESELDGVAK